MEESGKHASNLLTTIAACAADPFDADAVSDLERRGVASRSQLDDFANAFVAADLARLRGEGERRPLLQGSPIRFAGSAWKVAEMASEKLTEFSMTPRSEWQTPECVLAKRVNGALIVP